MSELPPFRASPTDGVDRRAWLVQTLRGLAPAFTAEIDDHTCLAEGGLCLDSLGLTDLLCEIEDGLGVTVCASEITVEHFGCVGRVLRFLEMRALDRGLGARREDPRGAG